MTVQEDAAAYELLEELTTPRPISEYHEDMGNVLWWRFPITEPPYVGTPLDHGYPVELVLDQILRWGGDQAEQRKVLSAETVYVGGWPGHHTHFTPIPMPKVPK